MSYYHVISKKISLRKYFVLVGVAAVIMLLAGCQASTPVPAPAVQPPAAASPAPPTTAPAATATSAPTAVPPGGTLTIAVTFDPDTLDAPNITSPGPEQMAMVIYDRLTELGADLTARPGLAESWTASSNGSVWTFRLRRGVQFHDGQLVDADAVKFNIDRIIDDIKPVKRKAFFAKIKSARVVDSNTLEITTDGAFGSLPYLLATAAASIISPKAIRELGDGLARKPVGTGPFVFQEWVSGERVVLKRNDRYWGGAPKLDGIIYRNVPEASTRVALLETGQADIAQHLPPSEMKRLAANPQIQIVKVPSLEMRDIRFNMLDKRFSDLRVRQAMNRAINVPEIVDKILAGAGTYTGAPVPPSIFGAIKSDKNRYDPALAKKLLADAGYPNGFKATLWGAKGTTAGLNEMLEAVQAQWLAVGIDVTLDLREVAAFQALATKGPEEAESTGKQLLSLGLSARYPDPDSHLYAQYHSSQFSPKGNNRGFYKNARVDDLLDQGGRETDPAKRAAIYREVQEILIDEVPGVFLYTSELVFGYRSNVKNAILLPTQHLLLAGASK